MREPLINNNFELPPKIWATYSLVITNTLVFFALEASIGTTGDWQGKLLEFGAMHPVLVWKGEIWRLVTAIFLHGSFLHYAFNTFVLLQVGRLYEPLMGGSRMLFLFILAGVAGFTFSVLTNTEMSVGSSGAIFGLIGGMLGALFNLPRDDFDPKLMRRLAFFIALNLAFGLVVNQVTRNLGRIDNAAHFGGVFFGLMFGFAFASETSFFRESSAGFKKKRQKLATGTLVFALISLFILVSLALKPSFLEKYHETMGFDALISKDFATAQSHIVWLEKSSSGHFASQILTSRFAAAHGNMEKAYWIAKDALRIWPMDIASFWNSALFQRTLPLGYQDALFSDEVGNSIFCKVLVENPIPADILNDCAWLFLMSRDENVHDAKKGLELALKAVKSAPKVPSEILHTLAEAYLQNGKMKEALFAIDRGLLFTERAATKELLEQKKRIEDNVKSASK